MVNCLPRYCWPESEIKMTLPMLIWQRTCEKLLFYENLEL